MQLRASGWEWVEWVGTAATYVYASSVVYTVHCLHVRKHGVLIVYM